MPYFTDLFDQELLAEMTREGYVSARRHEWMPLTIFNYTQKAVYSRVWNPVTLQCRGLIVDDDGNVIARPFPKFFNLGQGEAPEPPASSFELYDKADGSLGIIYEYAEPDTSHVAVATRGSFHSEQAAHATEWMKKNLPLWFPDPAYTYLVEIIYPSNRIVLDYGNRDELVLLGIVDNATGHMLPYVEWAKLWPRSIVERYFTGDKTPAFLSETHRENREGYVLYWPKENVRLKVKHAEYVRLHKILTNVTARTLWELLANGHEVTEILDNVPDEFFTWVKSTVADLDSAFDAISAQVYKKYRQLLLMAYEVDPTETALHRKAFAIASEGAEHRGALFALYDGRNMDPLIWKSLKPASDRPFREDVDA